MNNIKTIKHKTILGLGVSRCRTGHIHETDTYNYNELCDFLILVRASKYKNDFANCLSCEIVIDSLIYILS